VLYHLKFSDFPQKLVVFLLLSLIFIFLLSSFSSSFHFLILFSLYLRASSYVLYHLKFSDFPQKLVVFLLISVFFKVLAISNFQSQFQVNALSFQEPPAFFAL
jgi:hypothetical protein